MRETEYERKAMISQNDYERLLALLEMKGQEECQVNYYYDTSDEYFRRKSITCRIRQSKKGLGGTVKIHTKKGESEEYSFFISDVPSHLELCGERLLLKGSLYTLRACADFGGLVKIMLDKNIYLGKTDYEIELEHVNNGKREALEAMEMISRLLGKRPSWDKGESKSERFFSRLEFLLMDRYPETAISFEGDESYFRNEKRA